MKRPGATRAFGLILAALLAASPRAAHASPRAEQGGPPARSTTAEPAQNPPGSAGAGARGAAAQGEPAAAGSITGRVVGEGGEPLSQVLVLASARNEGGAGLQRSAVTDEEGNFAVGGLPPGVYALYASAPGYLTESPAQGGNPAGIRPGDAVTLRLSKGGVITGAVTDQGGEPLVGLPVRAQRVRSLADQSPSALWAFPALSLQAQTDDRGVYRIYGLLPGVYVVSAGGVAPGFFSPYEGDAPTFYPSSTRDTAAEVPVRAGQEATGVDIRYREERGYAVSGSVEFPAEPHAPGAGASVALVHAATGTNVGFGFVTQRDAERRFEIVGVPDGDYEVSAALGMPDGSTRVSAPRRVSVRGADVSGVRLAVAPLASVSGAVVVEAPAAALRSSDLCRANAPSPRLAPQEVMLTARPEEEARPREATRGPRFTRATAAPDEAGRFALRNLEAGRYRLRARPLDESLYARHIQAPSPAPAARPPRAPRPTQPGDAATPAPARPARGRPAQAAAPAAGPDARANADGDVVVLRPGQQSSGVVVRVAYGAALLSGRLAPPDEAARPAGPVPLAAHARARVYLVPAEPERADDPLAYAEAAPAEDGSFAFRNVPPGRYLLAVRDAGARPDAPETLPFWSAGGRAALRREAEAAGRPHDLQPCQRLTGLALPFPPPAP